MWIYKYKTFNHVFKIVLFKSGNLIQIVKWQYFLNVWWCLILWLCGNHYLYNCVDYTWIYQIVSGNESKVFQHLSIPRLISSMRYELTEGCRLIILYHLLFLLYNVVRHLSTFTFVILFYKVKERCTCKTKQFEFHTDYKGTEHYRKKKPDPLTSPSFPIETQS